MLSYTTYQIPETKKDQTGKSTHWLWMIVPMHDSDADQVLLGKIATALKADFDAEVLLIPQDQGEPLSLADISDSKPKLVISFGSATDQLGLWIDLARPGICKLEQFTFILTLTPSALSADAAAKKELWKHMQFFLESFSS